MALRILNEAGSIAVGDRFPQAEPDEMDIDTIVGGFGYSCVIAGVTGESAVTESSPPAQTVDVADGRMMTLGTYVTLAAEADVAMPAAHATDHRFDLIVRTSAGAVAVRQGTAVATTDAALFPALTAGDVFLAAVYRAPNDNTIVTAQIVDKSIVLRDIYANAAGKPGGQTIYGGVADGEDLVLKGNSVDNFVTEGRVVVQLNSNAGGLSESGFEVRTGATGKIFEVGSFNSYLLGLSDIAGATVSIYPPRTGSRGTFQIFLGSEATADWDSAGANTYLMALEAHGMQEGNHEPGIEHISFYSAKDAWGTTPTPGTSSPATLTAAIPAEAPGTSRTINISEKSGISVGDVLLIWETAKIPSVDAPDAYWEYVKVTAASGSGAGTIDVTRGWWGAFSPPDLSGTANAAVTFGASSMTDTRRSDFTDALIGLTIIANGKTMTITSVPASDRVAGAIWAGGTPADGSSWTIGLNSALTPGHVSGARIWKVTRTGHKFLQMNRGPAVDGPAQSGAGTAISPYVRNSRLQIPDGCSLDLCGEVLGLNGGEGVMGGATNWLEWASGTWTLTGASDGVALVIRRSLSTAQILRAWVLGEAFGRFNILASGLLSWGDGAGAADATIGRNSARILGLTGSLAIAASNAADPVLTLSTVATNDDPTETWNQARLATTDATANQTLQAIAIPTSNVVMIEVAVIARRSTTETGAGYKLIGVYKNVAGTVTLIGAVTTDHSGEDVAGWDCNLAISGTNVLVRVTGAASSNITWHATTRTWKVGT